MNKRTLIALFLAIITEFTIPSSGFSEQLATGRKGSLSEIREILKEENHVVVMVVNMINKSASSSGDFWVVHFLTANEDGDWYFLKGDCAKGSSPSSLEVVFRGLKFSTKQPESQLELQRWIMSGAMIDGQENRREIYMVETNGNFIIVDQTTMEGIGIGKDLTVTDEYEMFAE